jgi:polar amino acid transport system permease protein
MTGSAPAPGSPVAYRDPVRVARARRARRRDTLVGLGSLALFVGLVVFLVSRTQGWPVVQQTFFNGEQFRESFPGLIEAFWLNVRIFLIAEPLILILGLALAMARTLRAPVFLPLRLVATVFVDVFRGVPTILVIFLLGFGMPALQLDFLPNSPIFWGTTALVLSYSAYVAEVFRAGISSVHPSQRMAARSLGLTTFQANRFVILPQAIRNVVPPLLNDFISLQKDTALVAVLGPIEILRRAQIDTSFSFNYTPYVAAAVIFLALTIPMTRFADWVTERMAQRQRAGGIA